jgi:hypothetical protein
MGEKYVFPPLVLLAWVLWEQPQKGGVAPVAGAQGGAAKTVNSLEKLCSLSCSGSEISCGWQAIPSVRQGQVA